MTPAKVAAVESDRETRIKRASSKVLLPNMVTLTALCFGLTAIRLAIEHHPRAALACIGLAMVFDALDGRIARLLDATSVLGAQLDSLCDGVSFGVTPALVIYFTLLQPLSTTDSPLRHTGWAACLIYAVAIMLRLARFNSHLGTDQPSYTKEYFVGVPAPAGAMLALMPLLARETFGNGWWDNHFVAGIWLLICACLVISRIPTFSLKTVNVAPYIVAFLLVGFVVLVALFLTAPTLTALALSFGYLCLIPFSVYSQRWVSHHPEAWSSAPKERRAMRRAARKYGGDGQYSGETVGSVRRQRRNHRHRRQHNIAGRRP